jgi:hypothetical protein
MYKNIAILVFLSSTLCSAQDSAGIAFHRWGLATDFYGYYNNYIGLNVRIDPATALLFRVTGTVYDMETGSQGDAYDAGMTIGVNKELFRIKDVAIGGYAEVGGYKEFRNSGARYYTMDSIEYHYSHQVTATLRAGVMAEYWITDQLTLSMIQSMTWSYSSTRKTNILTGPTIRRRLETDYRYISLAYYF